MKRRMALATSAGVSVAVLGGAMAVAALSGTGVLGFSDGGSSADPTGGGAASASPGVEGEAGTPTTGPQVSIQVIEDRVVVRRSAGNGAFDEGMARRFGSLALGDGDSDDDLTDDGSTVPSSTTTMAPRPRNGHDGYDEYDEYEHDEYEHDEYEHEDD